MIRCIWSLFFVMAAATVVHGKTLVVGGRLSSEVTVTQQITFSSDRELSEVTYHFPLPAKVAVPGTSQRLTGHRMAFQPDPASILEEGDSYGNRYVTVTWLRPAGDPRAAVVFSVALDADLAASFLQPRFPLRGLPDETRPYLEASPLVQSGDSAIGAKAAELTVGAATEAAAVDAIIDFVADHIRYDVSPGSSDALSGLSTGTGNCQNIAHLACALLRAAGIPARAVLGLTLKDKWRVPLDGNGSSLAQGMREGLHSWVEVYFPGMGWLPYDPQQSKGFTSTRHIKYAHGPDCGMIGVTWSGVPSAPRYDAVISSSFSKDLVDLDLKGLEANPRGYLAANQMLAPRHTREGAIHPATRCGEQPLPPHAGDVLIGNTRLPGAGTAYMVAGRRGEATMAPESAEYLSSSALYAQAFDVEGPLQLHRVSLALKKFGGDGALYLDIVADDHGKPSVLQGIRSRPVHLEKLKRLEGYRWVDFAIPPESAQLAAGKYWLVLRRSGEGVVNWCYTPGKTYGGPDDTRSTAGGWQWEEVLPYDFVFKVAGRATP